MQPLPRNSMRDSAVADLDNLMNDLEAEKQKEAEEQGLT